MAKTTISKNTTTTYSNHKMMFDKIEAWGINNNQKLLFTFLALSLFFFIHAI